MFFKNSTEICYYISKSDILILLLIKVSYEDIA